MKLTDATKYRFTVVDADGQPGGTHPLDGSIMPRRSADMKAILSYEDVCFLHEAFWELYYILKALVGWNECIPLPSDSESLHEYEVPRVLYGAEMGRISKFDGSYSLMDAGRFWCSAFTPSGDQSAVADNVQNYLESAGADVLKLFPCAMTTSSSTTGLSYMGKAANIVNGGPGYSTMGRLVDVFKGLVSIAWSYQKEKRPSNSYAFGVEPDSSVRELLSYLGGYCPLYRDRTTMYSDSINKYSFPSSSYINPNVSIVSQPTVVMTESANTGSQDISYYTSTATGQTVAFGDSNYQQKIASLAMLGALGVSSYSALEIPMLANTRIGDGDFNFSIRMQDLSYSSDMVEALFELPGKCTNVLFFPSLGSTLSTPSYTGMPFFVDGAHDYRRDWDGETQRQDHSESHGTDPDAKTTFSNAATSYSLTFSAVGRIQSYTTGSAKHVEEEQNVNVTDNTRRQPTATQTWTIPTTLVSGLVSSFRAAAFVDVHWDYHEALTGSADENGAGGWIVAVPVEFTLDGGGTWSAGKTIREIAYEAYNAVKSQIPFSLPSYEQVVQGIPFGEYIPSEVAESTHSISKSIVVEGRSLCIPICVAGVTPWTADQS